MVIYSYNWSNSLCNDFSLLCISISVFLIFLILSADIAFAQCSMCRAVLNSSEAQENS